MISNQHPFHCLWSPFRYAALGDSIAAGFGAKDFYGYVDYFRDYLATKHDCLTFNNRAIPGLKTNGLLLQLKLDLITRLAVKNANVITISIGGNNLLRCASDNYQLIDNACAANGVQTFKQDWPQILKEIRNSIGSQAKIYVMTLYNPYKGDDPNYRKAEYYIQQVNAVINHTTYRSKYHYQVANVHAAFQGIINNNWKTCQWTHFCEPTRNPHPTDRGHREIARLHKELYR